MFLRSGQKNMNEATDQIWQRCKLQQKPASVAKLRLSMNLFLLIKNGKIVLAIAIPANGTAVNGQIRNLILAKLLGTTEVLKKDLLLQKNQGLSQLDRLVLFLENLVQLKNDFIFYLMMITITIQTANFCNSICLYIGH